MIGRDSAGGGQLKQASLYQIQLEDGRLLRCDYVEIVSDGFRTLAVGEQVWCSVSPDDPGWATYVVPIRDYSARQLLGLPESSTQNPDPMSELWF
ncbi:hypothetical protein C6A86_023495 [Mycobacterium sp. ITM-2016-00316]|uniref:hypothetical protein n=1 Tax=Mycobacterium sp. ITM-2016-00316 TaxID=2099695 RepID=UPI000CF955AD|nr:hypothetical protein [Mycobacterium sp. ITM-2016-00316]WNG81126.1 hypothetical protein C6A86_023495 [Mycobacterium sp. ITM-2016-00316]